MVYSFATCQAENTWYLARSLAAFLTKQCDLPFSVVDTIDWERRYQMLDEGAIHVAWICGLPYVRRKDSPDSNVTPLVAPIMAASRYKSSPIYFSDVVVASSSGHHSFADLAGARWAYNEPNSQSGNGIVRYHLAREGLGWDHFREVTRTGSHTASIGGILSGLYDASAIDSTLLDWYLTLKPSLSTRLRIIDSLGPSPAPPIAAASSLPPQTTHLVKRALSSFHLNQYGRAILNAFGIQRLAEVVDSDYDPIRRMELFADHHLHALKTSQELRRN